MQAVVLQKREAVVQMQADAVLTLACVEQIKVAVNTVLGSAEGIAKSAYQLPVVCIYRIVKHKEMSKWML